MHNSDSLEIVYQDRDIVAINKPSGLLVHRSMIDRHETRFAMAMLRDQLGQYVYPIHRLDKPTSGVLLFALSKEAAQAMGEVVRKQEMKKSYLAIVRGYTQPKGTIDYALKEQHDKMTDRKAQKDKAAQEAVTHYETLGYAELPIPVGRYAQARYSLIRLWPQTGRKHQLRRHMKHILHPIVGDTKYGRNEHNRLFRTHFNAHRLLLHAQTLEFKHPYSNKQVLIKAGLDETWEKIVDRLEWRGKIG